MTNHDKEGAELGSSSSGWTSALAVLAALGLVATIVFAAMWVSANSDARAGEADAARAAALEGELETAERQLEVAVARAAALAGELETAERQLETAQKQARGYNRELSKLYATVENADRTAALAAACIDDIINHYNAATYLWQIEGAFSAALNGPNCSALGYYFR